MDLEKATARIRKLLALADDPTNPHEAELAAARAAELLASYQLDVATVLEEEHAADEAIEDATVEVSKRKISWRATLLSGVAATNDCAIYFRRDPGAFAARCVGTPSNIAAVHYSFGYFVRQVEGLANHSRSQLDDRIPARRWLNAFRMGVAARLAQRLRERHALARQQQHQAQGTSAALARIDRQRDQRDRYLWNLGLSRGSAVRVSSAGGYAAGLAAGNDISLGGNGAIVGGRASLKS